MTLVSLDPRIHDRFTADTVKFTIVIIPYAVVYTIGRGPKMKNGQIDKIQKVQLGLLPKVPFFKCSKMALRVPERKFGDHFYKPNIPQK